MAGPDTGMRLGFVKAAMAMPRWLSLGRERRRVGFSLAELTRTNPSLAELCLWRTNRLPDGVRDPLWLHLGSADNVIDGFLNLDFVPRDGRVVEWDLLDVWPETWPVEARGAFSEDTLEHVFFAEQLYVLCEVNRALRHGAIFRVLMPSLGRLIEYCRGFEPREGELLYSTFGVETEADALNVGMRFSGHRWLHDDTSLARLAALAGFEASKTSCAESAEPFLSNRNLRSEEGTAAFAHDLRKQRAIERVIVPEAEARGLAPLEVVRPGIELWRVEKDGAELGFRLPEPLPASSLVCVNVRSANVTSFREHNRKRIVLRAAKGVEGQAVLDETLKSKLSMNLLSPSLLRLALGDTNHLLEEIALVPGAAGDLVTAGQLEIFFIDARHA